MTEAYFLTFCCWSEAYFIYDQTISIDSIRCVYIADCVYSTYFQVSVLTRACVKKYISNTTHTTLHTLHYTHYTTHYTHYMLCNIFHYCSFSLMKARTHLASNFI